MLTQQTIREANRAARELRGRLADLNAALSRPQTREDLQALFDRSAGKGIDPAELSTIESVLLVLVLESAINRMLIADMETIELSQQNAEEN